MLAVRQVLELIGLILASVFLVAKFVVNGVIGSGIGPVKNDTGVISDIFETEVYIYAKTIAARGGDCMHAGYPYMRSRGHESSVL